MTDLTLDALVEDVARAMHRDAHYPHDCCWDAENEDLQTAWRSSARAALAAVAKAAGGADVLHGSAAAVQWTVYNQGDQRGCPKLRVAALLHVLAEAARDE